MATSSQRREDESIFLNETLVLHHLPITGFSNTISVEDLQPRLLLSRILHICSPWHLHRGCQGDSFRRQEYPQTMVFQLPGQHERQERSLSHLLRLLPERTASPALLLWCFCSQIQGSGQVRFAINAVHMASAAVTMIGQALESHRKHLQEDEMMGEDGNQPRHISKLGSVEGPSSSCLLQKQNVGIIDNLAMTVLGKVLLIAGIVGSLTGVVAAVHAQPQPLQEYEAELVMKGFPGLGTI